MRPRMILPLACVLIAACSKGEDTQQAPQARATAQAVASAGPAHQAMAVAEAGGARKISVENDLYSFSFAYPAAAGSIPGLKALLDADAAKVQKDLESGAKDARDELKGSDFPFHAWESGTDWQVVADLPDWLSLSAQLYSFEGGAHPNHGFGALLWDKRGARRLDAADLFVSKAALAKALSGPFCAQLDAERAKRRDQPVKRGSGDPFDECIDPTDSAVILGSSDKAHFDRIGVLVGPYEAGPYVEGDYEITLPVTDAVLAAVKPEYRHYFALKR